MKISTLSFHSISLECSLLKTFVDFIYKNTFNRVCSCFVQLKDEDEDVQISEKSENQEVSVGNGVTEAETKSPEVSKVGGPRAMAALWLMGFRN